MQFLDISLLFWGRCMLDLLEIAQKHSAQSPSHLFTLYTTR